MLVIHDDWCELSGDMAVVIIVRKKDLHAV